MYKFNRLHPIGYDLAPAVYIGLHRLEQLLFSSSKYKGPDKVLLWWSIFCPWIAQFLKCYSFYFAEWIPFVYDHHSPSDRAGNSCTPVGATCHHSGATYVIFNKMKSIHLSQFRSNFERLVPDCIQRWSSFTCAQTAAILILDQDCIPEWHSPKVYTQLVAVRNWVICQYIKYTYFR